MSTRLLLLAALTLPIEAQTCTHHPDDAPASGACVLVPFGASSASDPLWANQNYQTLIPAAQLSAGKAAIRELAFAPCCAGARAFASIVVRLDQTQATKLAAAFAANLSASAVTVLDARDYVWTTGADSWSRIGLQRSFDFDPARGGLVIDIEVRGAGLASPCPAPGFHAATTLQRVFANGWTTTPPASGSTDLNGLRVQVCTDLAATDVFGIGCKSSTGVPPQLSYAGSSRLGWTLDVRLGAAPKHSAAAMLLGLTNAPPFPLDLSAAGSPGCRLYTSVDAATAVVTDLLGAAVAPVPIPRDNALVGARFYDQFAVLDAAANALGVATSNAGRVLVGRDRGPERFTVFATVQVGAFAVDLAARDDGAFGIAEIRKGAWPLRRADFLARWEVAGKAPRFVSRSGATITLADPPCTLALTPETRSDAGTRFEGVALRFSAQQGPIVEVASWEPGGSTAGLSYFDGYRGWDGAPRWVAADAVAPTNPKLSASLLHGPGFQLVHGQAGALLHFHTSPGDRLANVSRGSALEFETTFHGPTRLARFVLTAPGGGVRNDLWVRAFDVAQAEIADALSLPRPRREMLCLWPPFSREGFRATAARAAATTKALGFTGVCTDTIWDNLELHGGSKNLNTWDYVVAPGYGGEAGLAALVAACKRRGLLVIPWAPAGHLHPQSPVWAAHPGWVLRDDGGAVWVDPSGLWHGDLFTGFAADWRDKVASVVARFELDGLWLDTHLPYAGQTPLRPNGERLASVYRDLIAAGATHLIVEGDASALGCYGVALDESWGPVPAPDLFYGARLVAGYATPAPYRDHFRRFVAAGAPWVVPWDILFDGKLGGPEWTAARAEIRQVLEDHAAVRDLMVHRFEYANGAGYLWTNDRDGRRVVWVLANTTLPDDRPGLAGKVYVIR